MYLLPRKSPVLGVLFAVCALQGGASAQQAPTARRGSLAIPPAVHTDHQQLRDDIARAVTDIGAVGEAARNVERVLTPHLKHDEEVLLPLGALRPLVENEPIIR